MKDLNQILTEELEIMKNQYIQCTIGFCERIGSDLLKLKDQLESKGLDSEINSLGIIKDKAAEIDRMLGVLGFLKTLELRVKELEND